MSVIPTVWGENVVIRVLGGRGTLRSFTELGMCPRIASAFEACISKPHGLILVTGPTGSGKTTTLFTALSMLNSPDLNIMTIEDPVEIRLPMVRQTQVQSEIGMTFASALRSILRQDPDVVLVGEIRDQETAQIAVQSALTGHLVLSTLHTNDSTGAVARLRDFCVQPFAIASALVGVVAQRLVRRLCPSCAKPDASTPEQMRFFGITPESGAKLKKAVGCATCGHTGFRGRVGIYEMLRVTQTICRLIARDGTPMELEDAAVGEGFAPLWQAGLSLALEGITSLEEVVALRSESAADAPEVMEVAA